jgi:hypothetical protein
MVKVLLIWDELGNNIRFFAVTISLEELALLQKIHGCYVNGDIGDDLADEFAEFFYDENWNRQKRFEEIKGPIPLVGESYHSMYLVGHL